LKRSQPVKQPKCSKDTKKEKKPNIPAQKVGKKKQDMKEKG